MADDCGSSGIFSRVAFDTGATGDLGNFTSGSDAFPLAGSATLALSRAHVNNEGTNGTTSQSSELTRLGLDTVEGDLPFLLTPDLMQFFGPHITGKAWSVFESYPVTAMPSKFHVLLHRDSNVFLYIDQYVNQVTIGSQSGEPVNCSVGVMGRTRDETVAIDTGWPVGLNTNKSVPYMHEDVVLTLDDVVYKLRSWQLTFSNNLVPVFFGSTIPCGIKRGGMTSTTLQLVCPLTATNVTNILHSAAPPGVVDAKLTLSHPTAGFTASFRCQGLQIPPKDPPTNPGEMLLDLTGTGRTVSGGDSAGAELIVYNDNV